MKNDMELKLINLSLRNDLLTGKVKYEEEIVQYFIPIALYHTDFEWLKIIAEHSLIEENEKIVKEFLEMVESLIKVNQAQLNGAIDGMINNLKKE